MKLHYWRSSPHTCKVLAVRHLLELQEEIELIPTHPWDLETELGGLNPLSKIPTLILRDGSILYDSSVICDYLAWFATSEKGRVNTLFPDKGPARWVSLRQQALADGIMEAAVLRLLEERARPPHLQSLDWIQRQQTKIERSLRALDDEVPEIGDQGVTIGQVSLAVALAYVSYRYPSYIWYPEHVRLYEWYEAMMRVPAIAENSPKETDPLPGKLERLDQ